MIIKHQKMIDRLIDTIGIEHVHMGIATLLFLMQDFGKGLSHKKLSDQLGPDATFALKIYELLGSHQLTIAQCRNIGRYVVENMNQSVTHAYVPQNSVTIDKLIQTHDQQKIGLFVVHQSTVYKRDLEHDLQKLL